MDHPRPSPWLRRVATLASIAILHGAIPASAANDWIPPRPVSVAFPGGTLAPAAVRTIEFVVRANGAPADLNWTATTSGTGPGLFVPGVAPTAGTLSLAADQIATVPLTVSIPPTATGFGSITITLSYQAGGRAARVRGDFFAAVGGKPEVIPVPSVWESGAGTSGAVVFQVHSLSGTSEWIQITPTRSNPDPNQPAKLFLGGNVDSVFLPSGGTLIVSVPTTVPGNAFPGNLNSVRIGVVTTPVPTWPEASAIGYAFVNAPHVDSLPTTFFPSGVVPLDQGTAAARDGPTLMPGRNLWLQPTGVKGVRVLNGLALGQVGDVDLDTNGVDDRLVGTVRMPASSHAASIAVVPGFVNSLSETLDLGLLAAGGSGLMLLDLRVAVDPPYGTWEDEFDQDFNGIDDRILRILPVPGFATDVTWYTAPSGRVIALVAAADNGSIPVASNYNPALAVPGTGAGVVAIDVLAALDSLPGVPYVAGTLPTPGNALDLELRGGPDPDLAIADGASGVSTWQVIADAAAPTTVSFLLHGAVTLDATWGTPHARDVAWVINAPDTTYLAVAASAAGMQILRAPPSGAPFLALVQRTSAPVIGVACAMIGTVGAALGANGVALLRLPGPGLLDSIAPGAPMPYTAPVVIDQGGSWNGGVPLAVASFGTPNSSSTSLVFLPGTEPVPDLLVSDGARTLMLRSGTASLVGVGDPQRPSLSPGPRLVVHPNPAFGRAEFRVTWDRAAGVVPRSDEPTRFEIFDLNGRPVRHLTAPPSATSIPGGIARIGWDGLDQRGEALAPGRYWVRARQGSWSALGGFVVLR